MITRKISTSVSVLAATLIATTSLAQVAPDAGQVLRELPPASGIADPQVPPLPPPEQEIPALADTGKKAFVRTVVIEGNREIPTFELQPLVGSLAGTDRSLRELEKAARRITAYYRARGFAVARAYLPAQDITEGDVTIQVVEGRIAGHRVSNSSLLSDGRVQAYFDNLAAGEVVRSSIIDRGLLLLQDTPGVGGSRATLQPGASPGTSELLIEVQPAKAFNARITADNHGSRYTGVHRLSGTFAVASPLRMGDRLDVAALTSGRELTYGRLAYQLPVGSDGLRAGAAFFETHYKLGHEFKALDACGSARSASVFATYPFLRSRLRNLSGIFTLEEKRLRDEVRATATDTEKKLATASLGFSYSLQDAWFGGGITSIEVSFAPGRLRIASLDARALDAISARTDGDYVRFTYVLSRLQRLTDRTFFSAIVSGQQARKNLDSSEKFSLGGANAVRAYPSGEAYGDEGWRGTLELRQTLWSRVQGVLFYDAGKVTLNKEPFGQTARNHRTLSGAGFGVNTGWSAVQLKASAAWPIHGGDPTSIPRAASHSPTLWLQASLGI